MRSFVVSQPSGLAASRGSHALCSVHSGLWSDNVGLGAPTDPWVDYKSVTWGLLDVSTSKIMIQRRYDGALVSRVVLDNACLGGVTYFKEIFTTWSTALSCTPADITVLASGTTGVALPDHQEGANLGLGGAGTNGFCWMGEDTDAGFGFQGHLIWKSAAPPTVA